MIMARKRKKDRVKTAIKVCFAVIIIGLALVAAYIHHNNNTVYEEMEKFEKTGKYQGPANLKEGNDSEALFAKGIEQYAAGKYTEAADTLGKVMKMKDNDSPIDIYSRYYYSKSLRKLTGQGDMNTVKEIFSMAKEDRRLRGDVDLLWSALNTVIANTELNEEGLKLLEDYAVDARFLSKTEKIKLKNKIATMQYYVKKEALALKNFYDVISMSENKLNKKDLTVEIVTAESHIGDINYNYGGYEKAIEYYEKVLNSEIKSKRKSAEIKHMSYINLPMAYIALEEYEKAEECARSTLDIIPYMNPDTAGGTKLAVYDTLANIAILKKDFNKASEYIAECYSILGTLDKEHLLGAEIRVDITNAKKLYETGDVAGAEAIMNQIETKGNPETIGIIRDYNQLLLKIYEKEGKQAELVSVAKQEIELSRKYDERLEAEYLEGSQYYATAERLEEKNSQLTNFNEIATIALVLIIVLMIIIFLMYMYMRRLNMIDGLTKVYNRKKLAKVMKKHANKKDVMNMGAIMMDVDFFKKYNDTYGHLEGDNVLKLVAQSIKKSLRKGDVVIRYGGEEFLVLLEKISQDVAQNVCKRIVRNLDEENIPHRASVVSSHVTLSVGLSYKNNADATDIQKLIEDADKALYESKENGRDQITAHFNRI